MQEIVSQSTIAKRARLNSAMYSMIETASLFGIGYTTLNEAVKAGTFPVVPLKIGRRYLFPKTDVHKLLNMESPAIGSVD